MHAEVKHHGYVQPHEARLTFRQKTFGVAGRFRNFHERVYQLLPHWIKSKLDAEATYAGLTEPPYKLASYSIMASLMASLIVISTFGFFGYAFIFRVFASAILVAIGLFVPYLILSMMADSRRKEIESILPDMLLLTSSNVRSGLTIDKALLFAARPEFGILGQEVKLVAMQIFGGKSLQDSFQSLTRKIKSPVLDRTISLLLEGLRSGGAVGQLLEESATDIRNTEILQREIRSSVMTYMIFIFIAAVLAAPFLFGVSTFLVLSTIQLWSGGDIEVPDQSFTGAGFISIHPPKVDLDAFNIFILLSIAITAVFASILISMIQTGKATQTMKYLPWFVVLSFAIFFATKAVMLAAFGDLVGL